MNWHCIFICRSIGEIFDRGNLYQKGMKGKKRKLYNFNFNPNY